VPAAAAGTRYRFRIDDEIDVPDPASAFQLEDVLW
jgi:maltooligosyltrehalose trehalohydrolase